MMDTEKKTTEINEKKDTLILAIESSCDETAASVVKNGREVLSNVISSQIALHTQFGGVVPEIASRKHIEKINRCNPGPGGRRGNSDRCGCHWRDLRPGLWGLFWLVWLRAKAIAFLRQRNPLWVSITLRDMCLQTTLRTRIWNRRLCA